MARLLRPAAAGLCALTAEPWTARAGRCLRGNEGARRAPACAAHGDTASPVGVGSSRGALIDGRAGAG
jgi:hypothetical protein